MRIHIRLVFFAAVTWASFLLLGLPDYYQQYSDNAMVAFSLLLLFPISVVLFFILRRIKPTRRMAAATRIAFHFTFPLALYDYLYCGIYLDHGIEFLIDYWYLSVYYVILWILVPGIAAFINRFQREEAIP